MTKNLKNRGGPKGPLHLLIFKGSTEMILEENKTVLAITMVAIMFLCASTVIVFDDDSDVCAAEETNVATIGDVEYPTVAAAISAAVDNTKTTIKLIAEVTESITISDKKDIILDLNGKKITNTAGEHTIVVESGGTLTVQGTGIVDNVSHAKACIYNKSGGTVILNGGEFLRSLEVGTYDPYVDNGNSYYTIRNAGNMTINDGTKVTNSGSYSSNVFCGFGKDDISEHIVPATIVINGGELSGGINALKTDSYGELTIRGGVFKNTTQFVIMNWNKTTISGGSFNNADTGSGSAVIMNSSYGDDTIGIMSITGGTFLGEVMFDVHSQDTAAGLIQVSGGIFDTDPSGTRVAIVDGFEKKQVNGKYQVSQITEPEVPVDPTDPSDPVEDEDYPFSPGNPGSQNTDSDSKTIVLAAAAVVVIMLAAVAMMVNRNH